MWKLTLRQLMAHKLRLMLSAIAIVLSVAFVSGTLIFSDALGDALHAQLAKPVTGLDLVITPGRNDNTGQVSTQDVTALRQVDGVAAVAGETFGYAGVVGHGGKVVHTGDESPLGVNWSGGPGRSLTDGRAPVDSGEFALDGDTADHAGLHVGDRVPVILGGVSRERTLVGVFDDQIETGTTTAVDTATAQRLWSAPGKFNRIVVTADHGVDQDALSTRVQRALPDVAVETGRGLIEQENREVNSIIDDFTTFLLAFAAIAVAVGSMVIINTFTVLVAQRTRDIGLLRIVGASRRQIRRSVLGEAAVTGTVGATLGLLTGVALALLLKVILAGFDVPLPPVSLHVGVRTVLVSYAVGIVVTVLAAYLPARRAARVAPMAALRDNPTPTRGGLRRRTAFGVVLVAAGIGAMVLGTRIHPPTGVLLAALGLGGTLFGGMAISPALCRPVLRLLAAPLRMFSARLGGRNAVRNPRRTAATASALMVGLALVTGIGVLATSVKESLRTELVSEMQADYVLSALDGSGIGPDVVRAVERAPGVALVAPLRGDEATVHDDDVEVGSVPAESLGSAVHLSILHGRASLTDGVLLSKSLAEKKHWTVGQRLPMTFTRGDPVTMSVSGIYDDASTLPAMLVSEPVAAAHFDPRSLPFLVLVQRDAGADASAVRAALDRAGKDLPNMTVQTGKEFRDAQAGSLNGFLAFVYGLLGLAIVTAVLGIINTLALSVFERTREIGLLRAVGLSRRQLRSSVRVEAVLIAVFGTVLGIAIGLTFGVVVQHAAAGDGLTTLAIPVSQLVVSVVAAGVVGVLAAAWPARRAARMNTLQAIATE